MSHPNAATPTQLAHDEQVALVQAMYALPYSGMIHRRTAAQALTVADVVTYLDELKAVLRDIAAQHERDVDELRNLRRQKRAVREFLGLAE